MLDRKPQLAPRPCLSGRGVDKAPVPLTATWHADPSQTWADAGNGELNVGARLRTKVLLIADCGDNGELLRKSQIGSAANTHVTAGFTRARLPQHISHGRHSVMPP